MEEIWKDIVGYEGLYKVSNKGNIYSYSNRSRKNLKLNVGTTGYYRVNLAKKGVTKQFRVHRIVAQHFLEYDEDKVVNHIDGNKLNNNVENLELVTQKENIYHSWNVLNKDKIKKVLKLDKLTLDVISEYENVKLASADNNITEKNLYKCLTYKGFSAGGFRWIYKNELNEENIKKMKKINGEKGKPWLRFKKENEI